MWGAPGGRTPRGWGPPVRHLGAARPGLSEGATHEVRVAPSLSPGIPWAGDGQEAPNPDPGVRNRALALAYSAGFVLLSGACPAASVCL